MLSFAKMKLLFVFLFLAISIIPSVNSKDATDLTMTCRIYAPDGTTMLTENIRTVTDCTGGNCLSACLAVSTPPTYRRCTYTSSIAATCSTSDCSQEGTYRACFYCVAGVSNCGFTNHCADYKTIGYDANQADCLCNNYNWYTGYYEAGTSNCCGDDGSEFYKTRATIPNSDSTWGPSSTGNNRGCCDNTDDCVGSSGTRCTTSESVKGVIPDRNYCYQSNWFGGDWSQSACDAIVGAGYYALGGEISLCCGDDNNEVRVTTQEQVPGEGAISQSTDDTACCNTGNDCVFNDYCYTTGTYVTNGQFMCTNSVWHDNVNPVISLSGEPAIWVNTAETASVSCSETLTTSSGCDSGTYSIYTSPDYLASCPLESGGEYQLGSTMEITEHSWVCAYGEDVANNLDYDGPTEFRVDQIDPTITHDYDYGVPCIDFMVNINFDFEDLGDSGIATARWCEGLLCDANMGTEISRCVDTGSDCQWIKDYSENTWEALKVKVWDNADNTYEVGLMICVFLSGPTTWITAVPESVTSQWQNTDATATVHCDPDEGGVGGATTNCESTLQIVSIPYNPVIPLASCSDLHVDYNGVTPGIDTIDVTEHAWVCGRSETDTGAPGYSPVTRFYIDKDNATSWIEPLPDWTNDPWEFRVNWSGDDNEPLGSGIANYNIDYKIIASSGATLQDWTRWLTGTTLEGNIFNAGVPGNPALIDGATYCFRPQSLDNAGNLELAHDDGDTECIVIDRSIPVCDIIPPPKYINEDEYSAPLAGGFSINWTGYDENGDIAGYRIIYKVNSTHPETGCGPGAWTDLVADTLEEGQEVRNVDDDCTYFLQCEVTDEAGNIGYSTIVNMTIDILPPDAWISRPSVEWATESFNITWDGYDRTSGMYCFDIQWSPDDTNWYWIDKPAAGIHTECMTITDAKYVIFDENVQNVGTLENGDQFFFRIRATDIAGNSRLVWNDTWYMGGPSLNVTIDTEIPELKVTITDQDGNPITKKVVSSKDVTRIFINSSATDALSGVQSNLISYDFLTGNLRILDGMDCGSAASYGGLSECTKQLDYAEDVVIKFQIIVIDRAGNVNETSVFYIVTHPLANFIGKDVVLTLGDTYIVQVQVRNLQDMTDNITVYLYGYALANFIDIGVGDVSESGRVFNTELNPDEEKTVHIKIYSSEPEIEYLYLNASSLIDDTLNDTDDLTITMTFPVAFPGLDDIASLLIILLAVPIYALLSRKGAIFK